jgi:hypothetical protein
MSDRGKNDFSSNTKSAVALRAGYHCSLCDTPTVGPSDESPRAVTNIGVAAHICAASRGGKRYVESMSPEERSDIRNAIWLCTNHAALIDRDSTAYTITTLRDMKRNHEANRAEALKRTLREGGQLEVDLIAFGSGIICVGQLVAAGPSGWRLKIEHFLAGDFREFVSFIDGFQSSRQGEKYVLVNALGDGRVLTEAPSIANIGLGYLISCTVAPPFSRTDVHELGSRWAISPETSDLYVKNGQIARVSGLAALPDSVRSCLSLQRGESPFHPDYGVRIANFFDAFRDSPWLAQLLKLEVVRQASIPYYDNLLNREYTPLQCVERVRNIETVAEESKTGWIRVRVDFDVLGVGRWQYQLSICVPSTVELETIEGRLKMFASMGFGARPDKKEKD